VTHFFHIRSLRQTRSRRGNWIEFWLPILTMQRRMKNYWCSPAFLARNCWGWAFDS